MGVFGPVVQTLVLAMLDFRHDFAPSGAVGAKFVGNDALWRTPLLAQKPCQQSPRGLCVRVDLHDLVEDIAVLIDGAPEMALLSIDRDDELVETPNIISTGRLALQTTG